MATMDVDDALQQAEASKGGGKKKILILLLAIVLLAGGGAAAWFLGLFGGAEEVAAEGDAHAAAEEEKLEEPPGTCGEAFLPVPEMTVNLNSSGGVTRYIRLALSLELRSAADRALVEPLLPRLVDQFQVFLRELRIEDLQGSRGSARLREELLYRVNLAAAPTRVCTVLFQNLIVQ